MGFNMSHATLTGLEIHQPFHFIQETDPGAVGAGIIWLKKSTQQIKMRNDTNTGWVTILASAITYTGAPGYTALSTGSTWTDIVNAVDAASPGDTIILPPEEVVQTTVLVIDKPLTILGSALGGSSLVALDTISDPDYGGGTQHRILIGSFTVNGNVDCDGVRLSGFEMRDDRASNINMRNQCIDIGYSCKNVEIDHMLFTDITSDCLDIRPWVWPSTGSYWASDPNWRDPVFGVENISYHHNIVNEWWEGFFDYNRGPLKNCWVYNNYAVTTNNPHGFTYQGPMCLEINIEQVGGYGTEIFMMNNNFHASGTGSQPGSIAFVENGGDGVPSSIFYERVYCCNNIFDGFYQGVYIGQAPHWSYSVYPSSSDPHSRTIISDCQFLNNVAQSLYVWPNATEPGWRTCDEWDEVRITNCQFTGGTRSIDQSRVTYPMIITEIDTTYT